MTENSLHLSNPAFRRFLIGNALLITGMAILLFNHVDSLWVWGPYLALWTWIEYHLEKPLGLRTSVKLLVLASIIVVDIIVIWLASR